MLRQTMAKFLGRSGFQVRSLPRRQRRRDGPHRGRRPSRRCWYSRPECSTRARWRSPTGCGHSLPRSRCWASRTRSARPPTSPRDFPETCGSSRRRSICPMSSAPFGPGCPSPLPRTRVETPRSLASPPGRRRGASPGDRHHGRPAPASGGPGLDPGGRRRDGPRTARPRAPGRRCPAESPDRRHRRGRQPHHPRRPRRPESGPQIRHPPGVAPFAGDPDPESRYDRPPPGRGLPLLAQLRESAAVHAASRARAGGRRPALSVDRPDAAGASVEWTAS